jgi:hypothetical protein
MHPGCEWIVEFAVREDRAREQRGPLRVGQDEGAGMPTGAPGLAQCCLQSIGQLRLVLGVRRGLKEGKARRAAVAGNAWGN